MGKDITGILVDVYNGKTAVITVKDELEDYYKIIDCRCIDIVTRSIDGKYYEIVCDDEGLYSHGEPTPSGIAVNGEMMLCGNLFIVNVTRAGNLKSLNSGDMEHIRKNIQMFQHKATKKLIPIVTNLDY